MNSFVKTKYNHLIYISCSSFRFSIFYLCNQLCDKFFLALQNLKDLVSKNAFSSHSFTQQEVLEKYRAIRLQMKKLARESDTEEMVNTDFAALLDF